MFLIWLSPLYLSNRGKGGDGQRNGMYLSRMKSAAFIYNRSIQLLIYSQHGKYLHTVSISFLFCISFHLHYLICPSPPLSSLFPQTLLYLNALCCPVGLIFRQLLFCCVVMCSMAHTNASSPSSPSPSLPLTVLVHLTCSPALFAIVFYTLGQTFLSHKRGVEKLRVCVRVSVCASDLANLLVCLTSQRARLQGKGDVTKEALFLCAHTDTHIHSLHTPAHPSPLSCIVLLIRPCRFSIKHNRHLRGQGPFFHSYFV